MKMKTVFCLAAVFFLMTACKAEHGQVMDVTPRPAPAEQEVLQTEPPAGNRPDPSPSSAKPGSGSETQTEQQPTPNEQGVLQTEPPAGNRPDHAPSPTKPGSGPETRPKQPHVACPSVNGALRVEGTKLVDQAGTPIQLRGISTHGIAWFPNYVNLACFRQLRQEWNVNVVRLAMYTAEYGGYCSGGDQKALKTLIDQGVRFAAEADLYVIIDWHILSDGNPNLHRDEALAFFREMSARYAGMDHVIYEICNEPNGGTTWRDIKAYALEIIGAIRQNDSDAVVLVGTPNWSQYVDQAAEDPITEYDNLMYTLHFYAATHKNDLRDRLRAAVDNGLPVFVSEYGICDASGSGYVDVEQADLWADLLDQYGISYVAWNLSNKDESSAVLRPECGATFGFSAGDLSSSGQWLYRRLTNTAPVGSAPGADSPPVSTQVPQSTAGSVTEELEADLTVVNTWKSNGEVFHQYSLTLRNTSGANLDGWTITLPFKGEFTISNSWNGVFSVNGTNLEIASVDYNRAVPAGGTVSDIGFILSEKW